MAEISTQPFARALRELLLERDYATRTGKPSWSAFAAQLDGIHYETLRRTITGRRHPTPALIEECARVLGVRPDYFAEYRLWHARRELDEREVGLEQALRNLETRDSGGAAQRISSRPR